MKDVLTRIAWKNHRNGALNPRAQFRKEVPKETIACSPLIAGPLGIFDCSGRQRRLGRGDHRAGRGRPPLHRQPALREGAVVRRRAGGRADRPELRLHDVPRGRRARPRTPTRRPGITDPRAELAMAEVHDCFTPTELVLMEDLGFAERGHRPGRRCSPARSTSTASCRSTPTAASSRSATRSARPGLRMLFECWLQLRGEAGDRQISIDRRRQAQGAHPQPRRRARGVRELRLGRRRRARRLSLRACPPSCAASAGRS